MNEVAEKQERAESGRARYKTKKGPRARSGQGTRQTMERPRGPEMGRRSGKKQISSPAIIPKKRLGRKDFPGIFYFIGMKNCAS